MEERATSSLFQHMTLSSMISLNERVDLEMEEALLRPNVEIQINLLHPFSPRLASSCQ
jgi:hypothetical protein